LESIKGEKVVHSHKIFEKTEKSANDFAVQSNPIAPRKTANRLYGGYNHTRRFFGAQNITLDPIELFSEFCQEVKNKKTIDEVMEYLHSIAINRLGYSYTMLGLVNSQQNYLNTVITDHVGNVYSSKISLNENKNPIVESFLSRTKKILNNIHITNISHINNIPGIVIPLINQNDCIGVFVAGSHTRNNQNDEFLSILTNYLALLIINKRLREKVNNSVNIDTLTGLTTHRGFQERLSLEINQNNHSVSIVMIDINNISQINREYGHAKGDEVIRIVAEKVRKNLRNIDIAGRYGGDEIAIILPTTDNKEAYHIAEYINYSISTSLIDDIGHLKVSIGISTYPTCAQDQEQLLLLAEHAVLISRSTGYQNGKSAIVNAQEIDFWNQASLDSLAEVITKRHQQPGMNFEEEIVKKFHVESFSSNTLDIVTSLAGAIEAKDPYTRGHSNSVARYAEALAKTINLPEKEVERIRLGAILHDVGKIGIPESILAKSGPLTDEEWEIMKQHPEIGVSKVVKSIKSLKDLVPIIMHHHENWNGTGYPSKIQGEEIPLGARIVAIADAFHAMISDRPYRKALSLNKAISILKEGAGVQWDKNLVRKFVIIAPSLYTKV